MSMFQSYKARDTMSTTNEITLRPDGKPCPTCGILSSYSLVQGRREEYRICLCAQKSTSSTTNDEQGKYIRLGSMTDGVFVPDQEAIDAGITFTLENGEPLQYPIDMDEINRSNEGEQPKREPLKEHPLSGAKLLPVVKSISDEYVSQSGYGPSAAMGILESFVTQYVDSKIASGELMVVKTVKKSELIEASANNLMHRDCPGPGDGWVPKRAFEAEAIAHCPGCGAKIVEA